MFTHEGIKLTDECRIWYGGLSADKINYIKNEAFEKICGIDYELLGVLFTEEERIQLFYDKLTEDL